MPFLTDRELLEFTKDIQFDQIELMSQDNYNEALIAETIEKTGKKAELMSAALNMAIVGYGNQKYGEVKYKDHVLNLAELFQRSGVKVKLPKSAVIGEGDLTPNRLCRFFRLQIRDYIRAKKTSTYMFKKYSDGDAGYADICFRGSEYLDLDREQIEYLRGVLINMDRKLNINLVEKFNRVQDAKMRKHIPK